MTTKDNIKNYYIKKNLLKCWLCGNLNKKYFLYDETRAEIYCEKCGAVLKDPLNNYFNIITIKKSITEYQYLKIQNKKKALRLRNERKRILKES